MLKVHKQKKYNEWSGRGATRKEICKPACQKKGVFARENLLWVTDLSWWWDNIFGFNKGNIRVLASESRWWKERTLLKAYQHIYKLWGQKVKMKITDSQWRCKKCNTRRYDLGGNRWWGSIPEKSVIKLKETGGRRLRKCKKNEAIKI